MKVFKHSEKSGMAPGSLVYVGAQDSDRKVELKLISYSSFTYSERTLSVVNEYEYDRDDKQVNWLNVDAVHDVDTISQIGKKINIHPLVIEDILNTAQRPKIEIYDDYIYVTLKMIVYDNQKETFSKEQISIILSKNLIITIQETPVDVFQPLRDRLKNDKGRIKKLGSDYLLYALLDSVVDEYFKVIEQLDYETETIETKLDEDVLSIQDIHWLKKELLYLRRSIYPVRDIIANLIREEHPFITKKTKLYFKDVLDHCLQVYESLEMIRDIINGLIELHLSLVSNKMNEIMKFLTLFSTLFIPLTFLTGLYGMNFEFMPELKIKYGYFILLLVLFVTALFMFFIFKRKKWL
jgi:magnesium transporter